MTGRNAYFVTESRWRIQAGKLHPKDSDSEISLLDFQNPNIVADKAKAQGLP
jgi:hypothetical protein